MSGLAGGLLSIATHSLHAGALPGAVGQALRALAGTQAIYWTRCFSRYRPAPGGALEEPTTAPPRSGSTVVLVSGGVESAALLAYWAHWDHAQKLLPLFIDYGQKNVRQEEAATQALCRHLDMELSAINASMVAHQLNFVSAGHRYHDPLPHRNLLLLSLAASYAADSDAANVAICLNKDDLGSYSTASMPFLRHVEALYGSLEPPVQLLMPLLGLRKPQVITMGDQVRAPWHLTYSCAQATERPCGKCGPCTKRAEAFELAGVKDPLMEGARGASS